MARAHATYRPRAVEPVGVSLVRRLLGRDWLLGWLLVGPVLLILLTLLIYPFFDAILLSFQERFIGQTGTWIGFANYAELLGRDSLFLKATVITLVITGGAAVALVLLAGLRITRRVRAARRTREST